MVLKFDGRGYNPMKKKLWVFVPLIMLISVGLTGCIDDGDKDLDGDINYRQSMRDFVIAIGDHTHETDPDFILIPQNGHDLLIMETEGASTPAMDYIDIIDGLGQEDLLYGYDKENQKTPEAETEHLQDLLDLGENNGLEALVTDYCWTHSKMDDSYEENEKNGYISFTADHRDLDNIPDYPDDPHNANEDDVKNLSEARNFLYLLDPSRFDTREDYLNDLRNTSYDVLIIDAFYDDELLTKEEVDTLRTKNNGGDRMVISYMSIGEAEDYRYYWKNDWEVGNPGFIDQENPEWEGNYKVRYWEEDWQNVIFGDADSYTDKILSSGFDGIYMDIIDAFEYYE